MLKAERAILSLESQFKTHNKFCIQNRDTIFQFWYTPLQSVILVGSRHYGIEGNAIRQNVQ